MFNFIEQLSFYQRKYNCKGEERYSGIKDLLFRKITLSNIYIHSNTMNTPFPFKVI